MTEAERSALEAIRTLHGQLDDDANGNIDLSESDEVGCFLLFVWMFVCFFHWNLVSKWCCCERQFCLTTFTCHLSHQLIVGFSHMIIMRNLLIWFVETVQLTCKVRFVYRLNWSIYWTRIDSHTSMMNKQMRLIQATWLKDTVSTCEPVGEAEVIELHNKRFQTTQ